MPAPGEAQPRPPRRALPRRAGRVPASCTGGAAPAARGRSCRDRARAAHGDLPDALRARRRDESRVRAATRPRRRCRCAEGDLARHARRLSGPLLDRIDLLVHVQRPAVERLAEDATASSAVERARVREARERQADRLDGSGATCNGQMDARLLRRHVRLSPEAERPLLDAYRRGDLSARGRDRTLRVARTIADLAGADTVLRDHVVAALGLSPRAPAACTRPSHEPRGVRPTAWRGPG